MFKKLIRFSSIITFLLLFSLWLDKQIIFAQTTAVNNPESPHALTLEVDKNQTIANGQDTITITATLKDRTSFEPLENPTQGTPVANVRLIFEVSGEGTNLTQASQLTDSDGQIKAYLAATSAGGKTVTVTDPSLSSTTYPTDYYKVSLTVTFLPVGTPTPVPSPLPTSTPVPTSTPTPWQPGGEIKSDPGNSYFTVDPQTIGTAQTTIIKITLLDKNGNPVTNEVPCVTATGTGNAIIQAIEAVNSLAYFSSTDPGSKYITVKIENTEISVKTGKTPFVQVVRTSTALHTQEVDISLVNPPREKLVVNAHGAPIYFHVPQGRRVDKVTAILDCGKREQSEISLTLHSKNGGQVFSGNLFAQVGGGECTLRITMEPPEEPEEPPIEIPIEPIDPYGIIYDAKTGEVIAGAVVTLSELQNNNWIVWNGVALQQVNPQTTDESGLYSFFVYPGKYYLTVEKEGYESFKSEIIEVIEEPVKLDIYLNPKSSISLLLWLVVLLVPIGFVVVTLLIWRRRGQKALQPETQLPQS